MEGISLARFIVGILGNITSAALYMSDAPRIARIYRMKMIEDEMDHWGLYLCVMMISMLRILYGSPIVHPDSVLFVVANSFGLLVMIIYLSLFMIYASSVRRRITCLVIACEVMLMGAIVALTLLAIHTHTARSMLVGRSFLIFDVVLYAVLPLLDLMFFLETRSDELLPFWWLCLQALAFTNSAVWLVYAFLKPIDSYIAFESGIGVYGVVQLLLYNFHISRCRPFIGQVIPIPNNSET